MMKKFYVPMLVCVILLSFCAGAIASGNVEEIRALLNYGITVKYDGEVQTMYDAQGTRVYPISYNDTTYLPVRAVSNMLGIPVGWDEPGNTVLLGESVAEAPAVTTGPSRGTVSGQTYENRFVGLGFKAPDSWVFASDAEIEEIMGSALSEDVQKHLDEQGGFIDVLVMDLETGANMNLMLEKKTDAQKSVSFEELYDVTIADLEGVLAGQYDTVNIAKTKVSIGDKTFFGYQIDGKVRGMQLYQNGFMIDLGDYICTVSVTADDKTASSDLLKLFYPVK